MNEKIKQLALDAGIGFTLWDDSGGEMIDNYTPEERLAKFAELIIEECSEVAKMHESDYIKNPYPHKELKPFRVKIKVLNHFGVKE